MLREEISERNVFTVASLLTCIPIPAGTSTSAQRKHEVGKSSELV